MGVVSYGSECPSHGVYGRVTEVKHWIKFLAQGAEDSNCNQEIPVHLGNMFNTILKTIEIFLVQLNPGD